MRRCAILLAVSVAAGVSSPAQACALEQTILRVTVELSVPLARKERVRLRTGLAGTQWFCSINYNRLILRSTFPSFGLGVNLTVGGHRAPRVDLNAGLGATTIRRDGATYKASFHGTSHAQAGWVWERRRGSGLMLGAELWSGPVASVAPTLGYAFTRWRFDKLVEHDLHTGIDVGPWLDRQVQQIRPPREVRFY